MGKFRFHFIFVSKDNSFKVSDDKIKILEGNLDYDIKVTKVANNSKSLAEVYNQYLNEAKANSNFDFVVLMHADVDMDFEHFCQKATECYSKYDIIGLCGTSIMNISQSPLNWWTGSNPTPQAKWGCVTHGELGNRMSFFSGGNRENITDHEVSCIDGLCICVTNKAIASGIQFDTQFTFDFYDTDFSFQAIMKYGLKLGVIVEKSLQHYSIGRSILTEEFLKHELDFRKKWNLDIPKGSALEQLASKA